MMTSNFKEYIQIKDSVASKRADLENRKRELSKSIIELENHIFINDINDNLNDDAELELNMLKVELEKLNTKLEVMSKPSYEQEFMAHNDQMKELALKIEADNSQNINALQSDYDELKLKLSSLDAERMSLVSLMGTVVREAESLQRERNEIKRSIGSNVFCAGVDHDNNLLKRTGAIFVDSKDVERAFKGVS